MKIEWSDQRCVVCIGVRDSGPDGMRTTKGHVIPEVIGGRLWSPFLCENCNSKMGTIEERLLGDVSVVHLVSQLAPSLPGELLLNIQSRTDYFQDHPTHGRLDARPSRKDGDLELKTNDKKTRRDDVVRKEIKTKLLKSGVGQTDVQQRLADYDLAEPGTEFEYSRGQKILKPIGVEQAAFGRSYSEDVVPSVVPFGIAYLFLACSIGERIYDSALDPARAVLLRAIEGDETAADDWSIEQLQSMAGAGTLHGVAGRDAVTGCTRTVTIRADAGLGGQIRQVRSERSPR